MRIFTGIAVTALLVLSPAGARAKGPFWSFETGHVRPLALSPDGTRLFAVNTPDNQLEIFDVSASGLTHAGSVPVGLEPCSVAARSDGEVWVVNHLSDSASVVDVASSPPRVTRSLLVGDEPRDIVFAGPREGGPGTPFTRAFITTAHRGQNSPVDPQFTTEGVGRADVWVFNALNLGTSLTGDELAIVTLFGDTPRALAATADGSTVYAAVFHSGNQTTSLDESIVCNGGFGAAPCNLPDNIHVSNGLPGSQVPGGLPTPNRNHANVLGPEVGLIVKLDPTTNTWEDELGRNWTNGVRFDLPDLDVFASDADAATPVETDDFAHVGTILFNMAINPQNGKVYVSNTEAGNEVRFEGPGSISTTVRGHLHEARITVLDGANVLPRHLNKHIDYDAVPQPLDVKGRSLATPTDMVVSSDGATLYVAAFGSSEVGVFSTAEIENDGFVPDAADHILVSGGGPSGLVLDEANDLLYVLTRFDNSISVVDVSGSPVGTEIDHLPLHNPEPAEVVDGRAVLYDAQFTSSNGEASCSSCHVFGDFDSLAWDLGDPDGDVTANPNPFLFCGFVPCNTPFHPMKGPMTTQTLRGLATHGPMHWRGDRTGGDLDPVPAFNSFNVAFPGLLGRDEGELPTADMQAFTDFILEVSPPPNPVRPLDNTLVGSALAGQTFFFGPTSDVLADCNGCHTTNPAQGFFGSGGTSTFEGETQEFKVAHLRNMYTKVGRFGQPRNGAITPGDNGHKGPQVRGYGFLHDGAIDTLFRFHSANVFNFPNTQTIRDVENFMLQFDTDLAPIVGQQITLTPTNAATVGPRIDLFKERATTAFAIFGQPGATECNLVVKGNIAGEARGWLYLGSNQFDPDRAASPNISDASLRALAATPGQELTYTCVPPGSGTRIGIDRDLDGVLDGDDNCPAADNPTQEDGDDDGIGDACDPDSPPPGTPQNAAQQLCINTMNKNFAKVAKAESKLVEGCIRSFAKNLSVSAETCIAADAQGKVQKAVDKTASDEANKCTVLPDFAFGGAVDLTTAAIQKETDLAHDLFGANLDGALATELASFARSRCQQAVTKSVLKCQETKLKEFNKCKKAGLADLSIQSATELESCMDADPTGKIAKACDDTAKPDKIRKGLDTQCADQGVDFAAALPGSGVAGNLEATHAAILTHVDCRLCLALNLADDLGRDCDLFDDATANASCS